jgi:predicted HNH restriction endonuclease
MNLEEEKRLLLLMGMISIGGGGTKPKVLDRIEKECWIKLKPHDIEIMDSRNEIRWRNNLAFIRKHLVSDGYVSDSVRGEWRITEKGRIHFDQLCHKAMKISSFRYVSNQALLKIKDIISSPFSISDENAITGETQSFEGGKTLYWTTHYERQADLRAKAVEIHGVVCMGCGFSFEQKYGDLGRGFIEVHHVKPVSSLENKVAVNPRSDMIALCSNCHSIVHRRKPEPISLQALKGILNSSISYRRQ